MRNLGNIVRILLVLVIGACLASTTFAQQAPRAPRQFAPGVVTTIPPDLEADETISTHAVVEIRSNPDVRWKPELLTSSRTLYGMSENVQFQRDIWCLEFSFKPLRMIDVGGKLVTYMVYSVKNTGQVLRPVAHEDGVFTTEVVQGGPVRFVPSFVLASQDRTAAGEHVNKEYLDRFIPEAFEAIRKRELPDRELLNSAQMADRMIPVSEGRADRSVWGVAMWADTDPRMDFFSVYVGGLTNAYRWVDPANFAAGSPPGTGRQFERKTLQLNFWRPGDEYYQNEQEIRFGVARGKSQLYGVSEGVAYTWVYR